MVEMWNYWEVKPPPLATSKVILKVKEVNNLKSVVFDAQKTLGNIQYLHKEAAILSRFLYRNKRVFRHDKGMQNLVKINQCLRRYLRLNLSETLNSFKQCLPAKIPKDATHVYLPTRQMLKWVLLRLQAFSQIFVRIFELSKQAGSYTHGKLFLGWSLNTTLFIFSLVARIFCCSKFIIMKTIELYNSLYEFLPCLRSTTDFLPDYEFPKNLKEWLGNIDLSPPTKTTSIDKVFDLIDLVGENDEEKNDEEIKIVNEVFLNSLFNRGSENVDSDTEEIKVSEAEKDKTKKRPLSSLHYEDVGVPVEDEDDEEIQVVLTKKKKNKFKKQRRL